MRITIEVRSGRVEVVAGDADGVTVDGASIEPTDDGVAIRSRSSNVRVGCPAGADVTIATVSGKVETHGTLGSVHATTRSGRIDVEAASEAELRTMSGRIGVGTCAGHCRCVVTSGAIEIGAAGSVEIASTSGKVVARDVGDAQVSVMSGRVELGGRRGTAIRVRTMSGTVHIALPPDARPRTSLKSKVGRVRCECPSGDDGELDVKTMSGSIEVTCQA